MTLAFVLLMATTVYPGRPALPNPDQIRFVQEREVREYRAELGAQPAELRCVVQNVVQADAIMDSGELRAAIDRFVAANEGMVLDLRTGAWLSNPVAAR